MGVGVGVGVGVIVGVGVLVGVGVGVDVGVGVSVGVGEIKKETIFFASNTFARNDMNVKALSTTAKTTSILFRSFEILPIMFLFVQHIS